MALTFHKVPMFSPPVTYRFWFQAACLHAFFTLFAIVLSYAGYLHPAKKEDTATFFGALIVMQVGWLSFVPPVRYFLSKKQSDEFHH